MKRLKVFTFSMALAMVTLAMAACGTDQSKSDTTEQQDPAFTSAYVCPMHCEGSGADAPGNCPVCGMAYVKLQDHQADGHTHEGHEH